MKNDIFIIGGAGFLGTKLTRRLNQKDKNVTIGDIAARSEFDNILHLDLESPKSLEQIVDTSTIINLAAVHRDDIKPLSRYDDVNVKG